MIEGSPSRTALMVAAMRAQHYEHAPEPKILRDNLAMTLAGFDSTEALAATIEASTQQFSALSDRATAELFLRRVSDSVCMRSRLVESEIKQGRGLGLAQFVILGAGLDSTAYRGGGLTEGLSVFEVDHPATQAWKQDRLKESGIIIPDNVTFAAFDFEHQTLAAALETGGVDRAKVTLFSWLGVQPYLTDETVKATLNVLGDFPAGSGVVMDFVSPKYTANSDMNASGLADLEAVVAQMGEPFLSAYSPEDLKSALQEAGFALVELPTAAELSDRFLDGQRDAYSMPDEVISLASARVV